MFTDIVGFTAMGQRNESLSLVLLEEHDKLLRPIFQRHKGNVVKMIGDSFLVDFPNALDATRCSYDIQRAAREFNIGLSVEKQIHLRVGIHLGDIVESSNGDIFGDAVNIASRVQSLADIDGISLTRQVYDQVQNKNRAPARKSWSKVAEERGLSIGNLQSSVALGEEPELGTEPNRLAVLPFVNMSPNPMMLTSPTA